MLFPLSFQANTKLDLCLEVCDTNIQSQADMDRFVEDGSLDDNVESFLSHDDADPRDTIGRCMDVTKGAYSLPFLKFFGSIL